MIRPTLRVTLTLQCGQNIEEYKYSLYSLFNGYKKKINLRTHSRITKGTCTVMLDDKV